MNNEELNKRIYEILGMCWHKRGWRMTCSTCGEKDFSNIDFTTSWAGLGILWEWWQKQEKWEDFLFESDSEMCCIGLKYVSPRGLAEATVEFFKEVSK